MRGMCVNWKVIAGLAVAGVGVWLWVPDLAVAALPLLLVAACPLSMLLMMRGMQHGQCSSQPATAVQPTPARMSRDDQLAELQAQQQAIGRRIAALKAESPPLTALPGSQAADVSSTASTHG